MKCLVTGGAGFIGNNLVGLLLEEGHQVVLLDDLSSGYRKNIEPFADAVEFIEGDICDATVVDRATAGMEVVFHLAASVGNGRSIKDPLLDAQVNVLGTLNILEAARQQGAHKIVFSSSAGIFGELKALPIKEDHPAEPDAPYGASKLGAEKLCMIYNKLHGLEVVCLRYFNVYGIHQYYDAYGNVIPIFAQRLVNHSPLTIFGDGQQTRDFVNVQDVVQANYKAGLAKGVSGFFNIASGTAVSINRLVELMQEVSDLNPIIKYDAPRKGDVLHSRADISLAEKMLGFTPKIGLEEGLRQYMEWVRKETVQP